MTESRVVILGDVGCYLAETAAMERISQVAGQLCARAQGEGETVSVPRGLFGELERALEALRSVRGQRSDREAV